MEASSRNSVEIRRFAWSFFNRSEPGLEIKLSDWGEMDYFESALQIEMLASVSIARAATPRKWYVCAMLVAGVSIIVELAVGVLARQPEPAMWIAVAAAGLLVFAFVVLDRSKHVRFEIEDGRLFVRGDIFCWRFPLSSMNLGPSVVLDLTQWPDFKPRRKIIGTSLPGYQSGEFLLRNGRRAIVFLSDLHRVLCILMNDGKFLLLSCREPEALLELLVAEKRA
jgi:Bacterial PH domain